MTAASWWCGLVLVVSAWVRLSGVDLGWFMVDQARDMVEGLRIAQAHHFPLVGPIAQGLYALGPLYYYLIALPLAVSPTPEAAAGFVALLNLATVYLAYRLGREFFSPTVGVIAAALYGAFPMAVLSGRVLWNPGLIPVFSVVFFYALFHFLVAGHAWGLTVALVVLAGLLQVHLSGLALVLLLAVALLLFRPAIPWRAALAGSGLALALYASYFAFEAGRGFQAIPDALRFLRTQGTVTVHESWLRMPWRAARAPFAIPAQMAQGFLASPPPGWVRPLQEIELALFVIAGLWLLGASLQRWRRDGAFPRAAGLLLLWIAVPLLTLTQKKQLLFWYYFDLLYPAQFLLIGVGIDGFLRTSTRVGLPPIAGRIARGAVVVSISALVAGQVGFLEALRRDVLTSGLLRLPTSIGLRSPDPFWPIRERGYLDLMPLRYKRVVTEALEAEAPLTQAEFFGRVHGAAYENLIEDSGLLHRLVHSPSVPPAGDGPDLLVLRAADWPAEAGEPRRRVGPYWIVPASAASRPEAWRCAPDPGGGWVEPGFDDRAWPRARIPSRAVPDLGRYAIPPLAVWAGMPLACRGWVEGASGFTALVVSLRATPLPEDRLGLPIFALNGRRLAPARVSSSLTAMHRHTEWVFAVPPRLAPGPNLVAFQVVGRTPEFDLDVYAIPGRGR